MAARRMDRVWIGSGAAAAVMIAAAGWLFFVSPQLDAKADSEQQTVDAQTQNVVLQQKINRLQAQSEHAGELQDELDGVRAGVPTQHDMDAFTRQLGEQAGAVGVTISSISPGQPTPIINRGKPSAKTTEPADTGTDPESASGTEPDTGSSGPDGTAAPSKSAQVYSIAVTVVSSGPMDGQREFLSLLEKQGPRRALIVSTSFSAVGDSSADSSASADSGSSTDSDATAPAADSWTMTTQLQLFVAPQAPAKDSTESAASESAANR